MNTKIVIAIACLHALNCRQIAQPNQAYDPVNTENGAIVPTGKMTAARAGHTVTVLKNGKALIVGGFAGNALSSAEMYEPASGTFTSAGMMSTARSGHSATLLPDGNVLIVGGYNGNYLSGTEIFNPQTQMFSKGPEMTMPRSEHTATVLSNGNILIAGGVGTGWSFLQSADIYDVQANAFYPTGSLTTARESHTATLLENGTVLITGGHKDRRANITIYSSAELYDPATATFRLVDNMSTIRHKHDAVRLADGRILVVGGSDERDSQGAYTSTEVYDPVSSSFKMTAQLNNSRYKLNGTSILLPNGHVLIAGGSGKAELYKPGSDTFSPVAGDMGSQRLFSATALLPGEQVLITGGYNERMETSADAWIYSN